MQGISNTCNLHYQIIGSWLNYKFFSTPVALTLLLIPKFLSFLSKAFNHLTGGLSFFFFLILFPSIPALQSFHSLLPRVPGISFFELLPYKLWMALHIIPSALRLFSFSSDLPLRLIYLLLLLPCTLIFPYGLLFPVITVFPGNLFFLNNRTISFSLW